MLVPEELDGGPEDEKTLEKSHGNRPVAKSNKELRVLAALLSECTQECYIMINIFFLEENNQRFEKQ